MVSLERALRKDHSREEIVKAIPEELDEAAIGQVECSEWQRAGMLAGGRVARAEERAVSWREQRGQAGRGFQVAPRTVEGFTTGS